MKRSVTIAGHRTSISLEPEFWEALNEIAASEEISLAALIKKIDETRALQAEDGYSLSSHLRVYVLKHYRASKPA